MSTRSLNKVMIIGNLTNKPELRYTPQNHGVTSFGVATNRNWSDSDGQNQESTEFHNVVAWNKLAELCAQLLDKGDKVYIGGRLQTRTWDDQDGHKNYKTEIVCEDMLILHKQGGGQVQQDGATPAGNGQSYESSPSKVAPVDKDSFDASDFSDFNDEKAETTPKDDSKVTEKPDALPF